MSEDLKNMNLVYLEFSVYLSYLVNYNELSKNLVLVVAIHFWTLEEYIESFIAINVL